MLDSQRKVLSVLLRWFSETWYVSVGKVHRDEGAGCDGVEIADLTPPCVLRKRW